MGITGRPDGKFGFLTGSQRPAGNPNNCKLFLREVLWVR